MARYKDVHYDQDKFIPVSFQKQILPGKGKKPCKSNITDNESTKMKTGKGVIQGYDGVACVDSKHQIIVHGEAFGEAFGEAREHDLLKPVMQSTEAHFQAIGYKDIFKTTKLTADSGFYNTANVTHLYENGIEGQYTPHQDGHSRDEERESLP